MFIGHIAPPGRPGHAMIVRIVDALSYKTLYSLQTIHIPDPLFYNRTDNHRPFFATIFPSQALENEDFSVAPAACECVSDIDIGDRVGTLTINARLVSGGACRRVRPRGELGELNMNETLKAITKWRWLWWCSGREMSKQPGLGRGASVAMLRQTREYVDGPTDFDSNEVGSGSVWAETSACTHDPEVVRRSTHRPVQERKYIRADRRAKDVEPSSNAARAACEVQAWLKQNLKYS